jgi:hypothetical protein
MRTTKGDALAALVAANDAGRMATRWVRTHGHRETFDVTQSDEGYAEMHRRPVTAEERTHAVEQARRWARHYAQRAYDAQVAVETWARQQGA